VGDVGDDVQEAEARDGRLGEGGALHFLDEDARRAREERGGEHVGVLDDAVHGDGHELEGAIEATGEAAEGEDERGGELVVVDRAVLLVEGALVADGDHQAVRADDPKEPVVDRERRLADLARAERPARHEFVAADGAHLAQDRGVLARLLAGLDALEHVLAHERAHVRAERPEDLRVVDRLVRGREDRSERSCRRTRVVGPRAELALAGRALEAAVELLGALLGGGALEPALPTDADHRGEHALGVGRERVGTDSRHDDVALGREDEVGDVDGGIGAHAGGARGNDLVHLVERGAADLGGCTWGGRIERYDLGVHVSCLLAASAVSGGMPEPAPRKEEEKEGPRPFLQRSVRRALTSGIGAHAVAEGGAREAQQSRGLREIPAGREHRGLDVVLVRRGDRVDARVDRADDVRSRKRCARARRDSAQEHRAQLAHVAGPAVERERLDGVGPEVPQLAEPEAREEVLGERLEVVRSVAKRRGSEREHCEAPVQVGAETASADEFFEVRVRRGDHPHVNVPHALGAERTHLADLERAEKPRLEVERELGDLVDEERPLVRLLEDAVMAGGGPGEGAALVAEELARNERGTERARVERHERPRGARARVVKSAGRELLAGARIPRHENGSLERREAEQLAPERLHRK